MSCRKLYHRKILGFCFVFSKRQETCFSASAACLKRKGSLSELLEPENLSICRLQESTPKAHSSVHYIKSGQYAIINNVDILWYTRNRVNCISQLPVNRLCWNLVWHPQLIVKTVTDLVVVRGGGRNQPLRPFNKLIHSSKRELFITDITQYPIISLDIKMLVAVWWLVMGHMLI